MFIAVRSLVVTGLVACILTGCGGRSEPAESPRNTEAPTASPPAEAPASSAPRVTQLSRSEVRRTIDKGLGAFLQNVAVEDFPAMRNGKFLGFKVRAINPRWNVDLQPGDVILRVNGMGIEHPEDADAALRSLEKASSLKVDYEREGKQRTMELPIVEDGATPPQEKRAR